MNDDRTSFKIINKTSDWFELITNNDYIIKNADFSHDEVVQVYYSQSHSVGSTETSVIHAAFVTAHARLKLYSELEKIGARVLYFDTDSIIYIDDGVNYSPVLGNYLGELTYELDDDDYITEFVSAGPKNYAYVTSKGKSTCTVKGFTQSSSTKEILNFDSIKKIVLADRKDSLKISQLKFSRDKYDWTVSSNIIEKTYRCVYSKRNIIESDLSTLPYGY